MPLLLLVKGNYYHRTRLVTHITWETRLVTQSTHFTTRSTCFSIRSTRFSTRSTRLSIRLSVRSTCLPTRSTRLSTRSSRLLTCSICLSNRSTRSTICRSFYNWSFKILIAQKLPSSLGMFFIESCFQMRFYSNVYGVYLFLEIIKNKNTVYLTYANVIKFMKVTSNLARCKKRRKTKN